MWRALFFVPLLATGAPLDLSRAVVVGDGIAAKVLVEEVEKRTGIRLEGAREPKSGRASIVLITTGWEKEGFSLAAEENSVRIAGTDLRGTLYGVGAFLRKVTWGLGRLEITAPMREESAPAYPIRGHQLGYRAAANSWDAWTVAQFEQYIRDLALFGVNSIENIPFQDTRSNPLMKVPRREMNRAMSEICQRYGLDYWVWTPADIDLNDVGERKALLAKFDEFFADTVSLAGVFVPGGDPGDNPPDLVMPFLEDIAKKMKPRHPKARVWLSLQGFDKEKEEAVYRQIEEENPEWLGGLVVGPSSPPLARTRQRLAGRYQVRLYPDLTHNKICQYQVPDWDQAYALTLGREAINPRAAEFTEVHNRWAGLSDGFISYSDGVHDDVNKIVWSALSWDPSRQARDILVDYARTFFDSGLAGEIADAVLALETNWRGPLMENGSVEGTLLKWRELERKAPHLESNWRWQMCLLRANYDAYVRRKLIRETKLEVQVNELMAAPTASTIDRAREVLRRVETQPESPELRARIVELCEKLFQSIGLQTSVEKYQASGAERGAVLDFVDNPLNNRWWLEDEFRKIKAGDSAARLRELAAWENPGPGSFYDDVGNPAKSPHVDGDAEQDPDSFRGPEPTYWWWDNGKSRARLSWQTTMWPRRMVYEGLDPDGSYVVRTGGYGRCLLSADGQKVTPTLDGKEMGEFKEFPVPRELVKDRRLVLTFEIPGGEEHLNWRKRSRLAEVWLLKK